VLLCIQREVGRIIEEGTMGAAGRGKSLCLSCGEYFHSLEKTWIRPETESWDILPDKKKPKKTYHHVEKVTGPKNSVRGLRGKVKLLAAGRKRKGSQKSPTLKVRQATLENSKTRKAVQRRDCDASPEREEVL